ncbi:IS1634 family transposase [Aerococcaceae bacterium zg-ZJ1578]|uniref:IS1634 family transposase n=1 Tax=Aerococcaceae bacterium zg-252 TaxID=2796928 RepID=UPI001A2F37A0|nr:IS1634 family transposase [Aerococcaceae bacterium zg-1578]
MTYVHLKNKKTGITYVYESTSYYDKEKKQSRPKRKLIGKLDPETGEIVPTTPRNAPKKKANTDTSTHMFRQKHYGARLLFQQIATKLQLFKGLETVFGDRGRDIFELACYLISAPNHSMMYYSDWAESNYTYRKPLSSQAISRLFQSITHDEVQRFFNWMVKTHGEKEYWAYDTTSISSYSEKLKDIQYGYNKEDDRLAQLNLGLLYGQKTRLPFAYRELPGNIPDVKTVNWLLDELEDIDATKVSVVMDRGFNSTKNIQALLESGQGFIMGAKTSASYIKALIDSHAHQPHSVMNYYPAQCVYAYQHTVSDVFKASETSYYPVTVHLYYDEEKALSQNEKMNIRLLQVLEDWQKNQVKERDKTFKKCYFEVENGEKMIDEVAVNHQRQRFGWFALVTNQKVTSVEALNIYRNKDLIEKAFNDIKDRLNMRRVQVSSESSLRGKLFTQYMALIVLSYIKKQMDVNQMYQEYTLHGLLMKLELIYCFINDKNERSIGEVTAKQEDIYRLMDVEKPRS